MMAFILGRTVFAGTMLPLALAVACVDDSVTAGGNGSGELAGGANDGRAGGASETGGAPAGAAGANSSSGAAGETSGGSGGTALAPLDPPPAPATSDVPQPNGSAASPNLQVLPWAGFSAAVSYTFDDTQPSHAEHWPDLDATGVPMTFFANPSAQWQANFDATWTEIAAAGHEIGNHTWSHCHANLGDCTPIGTAEEEIDEATTYIVSHFGVARVYSFAAPFGDAGWNAFAKSRFLVGRGVMSGMVPASGASDWYNLPVVAVAEGQTATQFNTSIDNAQSQGRWAIFMFHSILPTTNNWYAGVEMADIAASIEHALSLEDVWVDTMVEVGAYVRAAQLFEGLTPSDDTWTWTLPEHFPPGKVLRVTLDGGTLSQGDEPLAWDAHGYYEVALDAGTLSWTP